MPAAAAPALEPGKVYRTGDLSQWGANPTRLARRLLREGRLRRLGQGLFYCPRPSRFGLVPPADEEILQGFLGDGSFVITGPPIWNALGLGATAVFPLVLAYNGKRSGEFRLGGRRFMLRRVRYPVRPRLEWFVVDLIEHHAMAGVSLAEIEESLAVALAGGRFDRLTLFEAADEYGTASTRALVSRCVGSTD